MKTKSATVLPVMAAMLLLFNVAKAQRNSVDEDHENFFRVGAKVGTNINKVNDQSYSKGFTFNYQLGGFMQFNFSRVFGLQPEVNFFQEQTSVASNGMNSVTDDLFGGGSQHKAKLNYLEVPVLLNVNVGPSRRVKLQVGPSYNGLLHSTIDSLKAGNTLYKVGSVSMIGGIWLQLPAINLSFRYKYGLSSSEAADNKRGHSQAIQVGIGFTI